MAATGFHTADELNALLPGTLPGLLGIVVDTHEPGRLTSHLDIRPDLLAPNGYLHAATVVGDTVGDPFKDTSSVALNPIIKFTTLFGLLAVQLAVHLTRDAGPGLSHGLSAAFFLVSLFFVHRSFYGMRIGSAHE